jgi:hypothetical protein
VPRRSAPKTVRVGLVGAAKPKISQVKAAVVSFLKEVPGDVTWVLPWTEDSTKILRETLDYVYEQDAQYILVTDGTLERDEELFEDARRVIEVEDRVYEQVVAELEDEGSHLLHLFDEDHKQDIQLVELALSLGATVQDLAQGLAPITFHDDGEEEPEPKPKPKKKTRRSAKAEEPAEAPKRSRRAKDEGETPEPPEAFLEAVEAGDVEAAVDALLEGLSSPDIRALAALHEVEVAKGAWSKTVARDIAEKLITPASEDDGDEEPGEDVEVPEDAPEESPEVASEPSKEPPVEEERPRDVAPDVLSAGSRQKATARHELRNILVHVATARGVEEARELYDFLVAEDLA